MMYNINNNINNCFTNNFNNNNHTQNVKGSLKITYANVQTWTDIKNSALISHLTKKIPDVILLSDIGKTEKTNQLKCFNT